MYDLCIDLSSIFAKLGHSGKVDPAITMDKLHSEPTLANKVGELSIWAILVNESCERGSTMNPIEGFHQVQYDAFSAIETRGANCVQYGHIRRLQPGLPRSFPATTRFSCSTAG